MKKSLSLAVIGCGQLARSMHLPNIANLPGVELKVCCDVDQESLDACRREYPSVEIAHDFRRVIDDPRIDALIIATGEGFRIPIYEAAVAARKPVYTEKPLAGSMEDAARALALWEHSGVPFCVGHNRRCSPAIVRAAQIFHDHMDKPEPNRWRFMRPGWEAIDVKGQDGVPGLSIRINDDWRSWKNVHLKGENARYGLLLSEMTHFVDLARLFLRSEARRVFTMHNGILNHVISIEFESGAMAGISMFSNGSFGYPKELLEVVGGGAVVVCDHMLEVRTAGIPGQPAVETFPFLKDRHPDLGQQGGLHGWLEKRRTAEASAVESGNPMDQFTAEPDKGHARMLAEFIREIRGERGPVSTVRDAYEATRICLAAVQSAREERPVELSEIP